jgi:hypothetical protein
MNIQIELTEYQANYLRRELYKLAREQHYLADMPGVGRGMEGPYYIGIMLESISNDLSYKLGRNNLDKFENNE